MVRGAECLNYPTSRLRSHSRARDVPKDTLEIMGVNICCSLNVVSFLSGDILNPVARDGDEGAMSNNGDDPGIIVNGPREVMESISKY